MDVLYSIFIGLFCLGQLLLGCFWWVINQQNITEDEELFRYGAPVAIGGVCLVGLTGWFLLTLFDERVQNDIDYFLEVFMSIAGLTVFFTIKNVLAPVLITGATAWTSYIFLSYGEFNWFPWYSAIIELLLFWAPSWFQVTYIWVSSIYLIGAAFLTTVDF